MSTSKIYSYLLDIQTKCFEFSGVHSKEHKKYSLQNTILNIVNIVITSGVATLSTSFSSFAEDQTDDSRKGVAIFSATVLYISAVLNSVQQFLNFEKLAEQSKLTSVRFIKLGNSIKRFLAVEELESQNIIDFFKWTSTTYEEIISSTSTKDLNFELTPSFTPLITSEDVISMENDNDNDIPRMEYRASDKIKYDIDRFITDSYLK